MSTITNLAERRARQQLEAVESFVVQMRHPVDWPTPILSDSLLDAMGDFFQQERLWERGVRFIFFCQSPRTFGFHRPVEHAVCDNEHRLLRRQRYVAARRSE